MDSQYLHKKIIIGRLIITMLADEGMVITPGMAIDIEKILLNTEITRLTKLSDLKYQLSPLICRNQEEQEILYKIFDKVDSLIPIGNELPGQDTTSPGKSEPELDEAEPEVPPKPKWIFFTAAFLMVILIGAAAYFFLRDKQPDKVNIITNRTTVVVNDTVSFTALIDSNSNKRGLIASWTFSDKSTDTGFIVKKIVTDTGVFIASASIKDINQNVIAQKCDTINILCEAPPSVQIIEKDTAQRNAFNVLKNGSLFKPQFINGKPGEEGYTYAWYVDGKFQTNKRLFFYETPYNTIKLVVDCRGVHCSADSLVSPILESKSPVRVNIEVKADDTLKKQAPFTLLNILMSILFILFMPAVITFPVYCLLLVKRKQLSDLPFIEPGIAEPYKIDFKDQLACINTEDQIRKIADILRKRQTGDNVKLNIYKTIHSTITAGGLPTLEFSPLSEPQSFLILIDRQNPDSHIVKLFDYLLDKLEKEEVDMYVYEYFKEPLFLSNDKLNHYRVSIEKVYALYPDTTLIILGDAQYFIYPLRGVLKRWVTEKLSYWKTRILLTPYPPADWDQKEKLLNKAGLAVLSADLGSIIELDNIISNQGDLAGIAKGRVDKSYRSRFINLQDFENLQNYLKNPYLLQWVCSLAVYPAMDWNFTIAVGKAIENQLKAGNTAVDLVNYTNLLKIGRISWMQDDLISQSLRLEMLSWLDNNENAMILARETLYNQLSAISGDIKDDSLVKSQFDLQRALNRFLIDIHQENGAGKASDEAIKTIRQSGELDEAQNIYLNQDKPVIPNPLKKGEKVNLDKYIGLKQRKAEMPRLVLSLVIFVFLLTACVRYIYWCNNETTDIHIVFNKTGDLSLSKLTVNISNDSTFSKETWSARISDSAAKSDTITIRSAAVSDTSGFTYIRLLDADSTLLVQTRFKRNALNYNVVIGQEAKPQLTLYYNGPKSLAWANILSRSLTAKFTVGLAQRSFPASGTPRINFSPDRQSDAREAAALLKASFNQDIPLVPTPIQPGVRSISELSVIFNPPDSSTRIDIASLPRSLNEIWHGGTSNRLLTINLDKNVLYYSVNETETYGTYAIEEVWLTKNGDYKFITKLAGRGYKLFFIRNITTQAIELSVCQSFAANKTDLYSKDESYCDRFNTMTYYYDNEKWRIYLPVSGDNLLPSEQSKLTAMVDSVRKATALLGIKNYTVTAAITLNFTGYTTTITQAKVELLLENNFDKITYSDRPLTNDNPFQRSFFEVKPASQPKDKNVFDQNNGTQQKPVPVDTLSPAPKPIVDTKNPANQVAQDTQPTVYTESWFKPDHFLQYGNIKVLLTKLDRKGQTATVEICDMTGSGICKTPLATLQIAVGASMSVDKGGYTYSIKLTQIKNAPLLKASPLSPAAYIVFTKAARDVAKTDTTKK